ncbi:MBL fold metallo-hydrolase [Modicisalibacter luteus]|uniref:MBL fold metallo-hydrolase n=1 Tax=Modicisalibacter luteus TaxID=453962 RepID=UPI003635FB06
MRFRFVGTGDSAQVPRFGCSCPACQRARVLNCHRRGPCCAEVRVDGARILLDAGRMDLAESCERERPAAILLTHYHADHVQGLFHLRWGRANRYRSMAPRMPKDVPISTRMPACWPSSLGSNRSGH